jgi:hypothetical protein
MNEPCPVEIAGASVQTVAITIKALHIGRKQMTQSVFRQLLNEPIWNPHNRVLRGTPWGFIQYFWTGCGMDGPHLHVVWQKESELRRTCVSEREGESEHKSYLRDFTDTLRWIGEVGILTAVLSGQRPSKEEFLFNGWDPRFRLKVRHWVRQISYIDQPSGRHRVDEDIRDIFTETARATSEVVAEESVAKAEARARLSKLRDDLAAAIQRYSELVVPTDLDELERFENGVVERQRVYESRWREVLLAIRGLEQLFIAV